MDGRAECCRYEPSLEDLLADEMMGRCCAAPGSSAGASRHDGRDRAPHRGSRAASDERRSMRSSD